MGHLTPGAMYAVGGGVAVSCSQRPSPASVPDAARSRLSQWCNLFGSLDDCIAAAQKDPILYELLHLELGIEPISADARQIREAITRLEPAELTFPSNLDRVIDAIAIGKLPPAQTSAWQDRRIRIAQRAIALEHWLDGDSIAEAKRDPKTTTEAVEEAFSRLGSPDDEKRRLVTLTLQKMRTCTVDPAAIETLRRSSLADFAHRIEMLDAQLWSYDRNYSSLLEGIGRKQAVGKWHQPGGPLAWKDGNPADLPKLIATVKGLERWLSDSEACADSEICAKLGHPTAYKEKVWLARCLHTTLHSQRKDHFGD